MCPRPARTLHRRTVRDLAGALLGLTQTASVPHRAAAPGPAKIPNLLDSGLMTELAPDHDKEGDAMGRDLPPLEVKLWGDYACFTRPEMKVERVSYPVMTPSAARGALEAIFWKPEVTWRIKEIRVLKPISFASILRNEITDRQSDRSARRWMVEGGGYDASNHRAQRHTLALRDVAYIVRAQLDLREGVPDKHREVPRPVPPTPHPRAVLCHALPRLPRVHRLLQRA